MRQEIAVVSLNGFIHCWNAVRMKQVMSKRLPHTMENVCLSTDEDCQMYAVGSKVSQAHWCWGRYKLVPQID